MYSVLLLPFVAYGVYALTLDPGSRAEMFDSLKTGTAAQFGISTGDGDEAVDEAALDAVRQQVSGSMATDPSDPAFFFPRRDADRDQKLTGDEIPEEFRERIAELDTDGDNALTLEELQAGEQSTEAEGDSESGVEEAPQPE